MCVVDAIYRSRREGGWFGRLVEDLKMRCCVFCCGEWGRRGGVVHVVLSVGLAFGGLEGWGFRWRAVSCGLIREMEMDGWMGEWMRRMLYMCCGIVRFVAT